MLTAKEKVEIFTKHYEDLTWDKYSELVDALTKINLSKVDTELADMSSLYAYFNGLLARAKKELDLKEIKKETVGAEIRNAAVTGSVKRISQSRLEDLIFCDEKYIKEYNEYVSLQERYNLLKGLLDSLRIRHENLTQISANGRAETKLING